MENKKTPSPEERILAYLAGELLPEERDRLEAGLAEDPELREMLDFFKALEQQEAGAPGEEAARSDFDRQLEFVLEHREALGVYYELEALRPADEEDPPPEEHPTTPPSGSPDPGSLPWLPVMLLGGAMILLFGLYRWLGDTPVPAKAALPSKAIADPFPEVPDPPFQFGGGEGSPPLEQEARLAFRDSDYDGAVIALRRLLEERPDYDAPYAQSMRTYLAIALLRQNQLLEAGDLLAQVDGATEPFLDRAVPDFYLGLVFYSQGRYRAAADLLDSVAASTFYLDDETTIGELARRYRARARERMTG